MLPHMHWADAACVLTRWQYLSAKNDAITHTVHVKFGSEEFEGTGG